MPVFSTKHKELADHFFADGLTLADKLLTALIAIAPDGKAQAQLSNIFNDAWSEGGRPAQLQTMLYICSDGIKYGNWPWVKT